MIWIGIQFLQKSVQCGEVSVETITVQKMKNEDNLKNKDDLKNEDNCKNENNCKNEDNNQIEDDLKN